MNPTLPCHWLDDARTRQAVELLGILWLLALADLLFTLWASRYTPFHELNPWASALIENHRLISLALTKLMLTATGTAILWWLRRNRSAQLALWVVVLAYVALMFRWSDYTVQILGMGLVRP